MTRVLVTNDDGVECDGIVALAGSLHRAGHEVFVVAPASDLSGAGASIGPLHRSEPIPVAEHHWEELPDVKVLALERPPATAVYLACLGAFGARPDVVASGINPGANTGHLILHSGTVGAALTGSVHGCRGLAVSTDVGGPTQTAVGDVCRQAIRALLDMPERTVLNVNVPDVAPDGLRGIRRADLASFGAVQATVLGEDADHVRLDINPTSVDVDAEPESDVALMADGWATVTPLRSVSESDVDVSALVSPLDPSRS